MGDVQLRPDKTALLLIDLQMEYFVPGRPLAVPDGERVLARCKTLLDGFRAAGRPIVHVRHESQQADDDIFAPGTPYLAIHPSVLPRNGEPTVLKYHPGAFYQTELEAMLRSAGVDTVVIAGLLAFLCCDTTAREAEARGFRVYLVGDAMDSLDLGGLSHLEVTKAVLAIQDFAFAKVLNTEDVLRLLKIG